MLPSMFSLDHRLAELRQVGEDLRAARLLRDAAEPTDRLARSLGERARALLGGAPASDRRARLAAR